MQNTVVQTSSLLNQREQPPSVLERNRRHANVLEIAEEVSGKIKKIADFIAESENKYGPYLGVKPDPSVSPNLSNDNSLYAVLRTHFFKLEGYEGCAPCKKLVALIYPALSQDSLRQQNEELGAVDNKLKEMLGDFVWRFQRSVSEIHNMLIFCKAPKDTASSIRIKWMGVGKACVQAMQRAIESDRNGGNLKDFSWEVISPDKNEIEKQLVVGQEALALLAGVVEAKNKNDMEIFERRAAKKLAKKPQPAAEAIFLPPAPNSNRLTNAQQPEEHGDVVNQTVTETRGANVEPTQDLNSADSEVVNEAASLSEQSLFDSAGELSEASKQAVAEEESALVFDALADYVLDEQARLAVAQGLKVSTFEYRMAKLDKVAFPNMTRPYDTNLLEIQAVLNAHPEILALSDKEFESYVEVAKDVAILRGSLKAFGGDSADPMKSPHSFATKETMLELQKSLKVDPYEEAWRQEGYDQQAVLAILRHGFHFCGRLHVGQTWVPSPAKVRENVERKLGQGTWEEMGLDKTFKRLIQERAILRSSSGQGVSLNPKNSGVEAPLSTVLTALLQEIIHS